MHILIPTGIFHPESGGPATYLYRLIPELLARGHTAEVITFGEDTTTGYPYPVTRIPRNHLAVRNWRYYRAVQQRLKHADLVFINSLGLPLPRIRQPKLLKVVGDLAWERALYRGLLPPTEDIDHFQTARYTPMINWLKYSRARDAQRADQVIVPSNYLRQMVIGWGVLPQRVKTIYNALEPIQTDTRATNRASLGLPENVPLLLTVARLTAWKGIDRVLQAMADLPDVHLVIAGTGATMDELQQLTHQLNLTQRVKFLGKVPHEQLGNYYAAADYTLLYSGYEGLSHVILESLNLGTPVIASDKCGNPEIVQPGVNGFLAPYPDVAALRQVIAQACAGETPRQIRTTTRLDLDKFGWQRLVNETIGVMETLIK